MSACVGIVVAVEILNSQVFFACLKTLELPRWVHFGRVLQSYHNIAHDSSSFHFFTVCKENKPLGIHARV